MKVSTLLPLPTKWSLKFLLIVLSYWVAQPLQAQIVSGNAFLKGNFVQVGLSPCGVFASTVNAPAGYNPRGSGNSSGTNQLGFVADPAKDGWAVGNPNYVGDYFLPGAPEEGWGLTVNGTSYNNNLICGTSQISGSVISYNLTSQEASATWQGSIAGLSITKRTYVPSNALYFVTEVTITNTSSSTINNVYYMRNVDPDQAYSTPGVAGSYNTTNSIVFQNPQTCNRALVSAVSNGNHYLGLGTIDSRARVTHGGFANRSAIDIWNGTGFNTSGSLLGDEAISLSFNLGNIPANGSRVFAYAYILSSSELTQALAATNIGIALNGTTVQTGSTENICSGAQVPISLSNTGTFTTWTWSPSTGLNTTSGTSVIATVTAPRTYTATGTGSCGTVSLTVTLNPVITPPPSAAGAITGPTNISLGQTNRTFSISAASNATSYIWTLPPGAIVTSSSSTSNSITFTAPNSSWCGNISVQPVNVCGVGQSSSLFVCVGTVSNTITTGTISPVQFCSGSSTSVPFTASGTFNAGNVFTAQLSNSSGSFLSPVNIGTLNSTASGVISATIPGGAAVGSGYRVRVVSSSPATIGSANSANLLISATKTWYLDADNDGRYTSTQNACTSPGTGWRDVLPSGGLGDCDDNDNTQWQLLNGYVDADGDGYTIGSLVQVCSGASLPSGYRATSLGPDCDDTNPAINPTTVWYLDTDNDGWHTATQVSCTSPGEGWTAVLPTGGYGDCDDLDPNVWQSVDAYLDNDGDGYTASFNSICIGASLPSNYTYTSLGEDCDDADDQAWQTSSLYIDLDEDGYSNGTTTVCFGASPPQGYSFASLGTDCDDTNPHVNPSTPEICGNGIDDNCNGEIDENCCPQFGRISAISGPVNRSCDASTGIEYSIDPVTNADGYTWVTTGGIVIADGQGTTSISVDFPAGFTTGTIRVRAFNDCSISTERALTVRSIVTGIPGPISGITTEICSGTSHVYNIAEVTNADSYEWVVTGVGVSIQSGQGTTNVTLQFISSFSSAILQVRAVNSCGTSGWRSLTISSGVDALGIPGAISGAPQGCPLTTETYSIPAIVGATDYIWRTTGGIVISNGQGTNSAEMSFPTGFLSGSIFVKAANDCGQTKEVRINVTGITRTPGAISGQSDAVCANSTKTYSIAPVAGATSYQWSTTGDISLNSANGTEATFDFGTNFTTGTIRVQAVNSCGPSAVRTLTVRSSIPARPGVISGLAAGLCQSAQATYSIQPVTNATSYTWSTTGDISVIGGQGSATATIEAGPSFFTGQVLVVANGACGSSTARTLNVRSTPLLPGVINGQKPTVDRGSEGLPYSINPVVSATSYFWEGTNGISIATGQGTNAITADIPEDFTKGVLRVAAANACGQGPFRTLSLTGMEVLPFAGGRTVFSQPTMAIYPNPTTDLVMIQLSGVEESSQVWLSVFDLSGKQLLSLDWSMHIYTNHAIDLSAFPTGMYLVQVMTGEEVMTEKVVKQ
jgi:hypothetical protein